MIEVITGGAPIAAPGETLVVRVAPYSRHIAVREATIGVAVADPALAEALTEAMVQALVHAAGHGFGHDHRDAPPSRVPPEPAAMRVPTVRVRSRKVVAREAGRLGGAIAIVPVTARNARHLVALVDGVRAAGALGVQLVWDGADPPRAAIEHRVFAALEHARATPGEPPVVLAPTDQPVAALGFLIAHRSLGARADEPR